MSHLFRYISPYPAVIHSLSIGQVPIVRADVEFPEPPEGSTVVITVGDIIEFPDGHELVGPDGLLIPNFEPVKEPSKPRARTVKSDDSLNPTDTVSEPTPEVKE